ncbi:glycosyltransferase [Achromobacter xylosoxidans]|uniref:glycosyltransferase n=1 Tax=Alcaligenes xylosoxydans xylosoxydans TaxID=85698 RepID=UPI0012325A2F|nr:glycosyltransferase [Achromobacter xylosoxidans]KAA5922454.1 glycosyltransferase [Achromobacter xylosoxidans]
MLKVLHSPVNIGNQPWALSRAERALGAGSDVVVNYGTWVGFPNDRCLSEYGTNTWQDTLKRAAFALSAPLRYDVLHYYFGRTLMCWDDRGVRDAKWYSDLKLARALKRRTFMTLQGCDVRLAGASNAMNSVTMCREGGCGAYAACVSTYDAQRQWLIDNVLPELDGVFYLNPELGHFLKGRGKFLPYITVDWRDFEPMPPRDTGVIRIVHAPSDTGIKGTPAILAAIEELKKHYPIEFIQVSGKTHDEAMEIYKSADLAIDQVIAGWYGAYAVEMMAMGKPVMCYIRDEDLHYIPPRMVEEMAILRVHPERLVQDIGAILDQRSCWQEWSVKSRRYVAEWHDPQRIAATMLETYRTPGFHFNMA